MTQEKKVIILARNCFICGSPMERVEVPHSPLYVLFMGERMMHEWHCSKCTAVENDSGRLRALKLID